MLSFSRRDLAALVLAGSISSLVGAEVSSAAAADNKALIEALRAGGLVIVLRHGATAADQADAEAVDFDNISTQRNLSDKGKAAAAQFGEALRQIGAPIGKVYTSRFHRAYETAVLAGFKQIEKPPDLTYGGGASMAPDENARRNAAVRALLSTAPQPGTNTVLVTHAPNIVGALGKEWENVQEGEASIFRPGNGSYTLLARVPIDEWPRLTVAK